MSSLPTFASVQVKLSAYPPLKVDSVSRTSVHESYWRSGYDTLTVVYPGAPRAGESIDSVTVGSTMNYFVAPNYFVNPAWYVVTATDTVIRDMWDTTRLNSRHFWKVTNVTPVIPVGNEEVNNFHPDPNLNLSASQTWRKTPFHQVKWQRLSSLNAANAADTIYVIEFPDGFVVGDPVDTVSLATRVIRRPLGAFKNENNADDSVRLICAARATSLRCRDTVVKIPVETSSEVLGFRALQLVYSLTKDGLDISNFDNPDTLFVGNNSLNDSITLTFNRFGIYELQLLSVSDRISRKCGISGAPTYDVDLPPKRYKYKIIVAPTPEPGPGYRRPMRTRL